MSLSFRIPIVLPDDLQTLVDESGSRFEKILRKELGAFSSMVNVPGWVEQYRDEVARTVLDAYLKGQSEAPTEGRNGEG